MKKRSPEDRRNIQVELASYKYFTSSHMLYNTAKGGCLKSLLSKFNLFYKEKTYLKWEKLNFIYTILEVAKERKKVVSLSKSKIN